MLPASETLSKVNRVEHQLVNLLVGFFQNPACAGEFFSFPLTIGNSALALS